MNFSVEQFFDISNFPYKDIFHGVGNVWDVLPRISDYINDLFESGAIQGNHKKNVYIGAGTVIQNAAEIVGPAIIGQNCHIGHASFLRENCLIGNNVHIGHAAEIKNSIVLNNTAIAHLNYVGDSIVGGNVNFAGGAKTANYRFDRQPVVIRNSGEKIQTNLEKFGAVIGDRSNVGANAVLNPGTLLGKDTVVYPLMTVSGAHRNNETIK